MLGKKVSQFVSIKKLHLVDKPLYKPNVFCGQELCYSFSFFCPESILSTYTPYAGLIFSPSLCFFMPFSPYPQLYPYVNYYYYPYI